MLQRIAAIPGVIESGLGFSRTVLFRCIEITIDTDPPAVRVFHLNRDEHSF